MSSLAARIQSSRTLRALAHRGTMALGTRLAEQFPMVFVLGFPKSGTTWACQLVADYLRLPFPRFALLPHTFASVVHGHERPTPRHRPLVYVVRDGRDVAVSMFHFELRKLREGAAHRLPRRLRAVFGSTPPPDHELPALFPRFLEVFLDAPPSSPVPWHEHVRGFLRTRAESQAILRYEGLLEDGPIELASALTDILGHEPEPDRVIWAIDKFSIDRTRASAPSSAPAPTPIRKGTAGDWRTLFDPETARAFDSHAGDLLVELGYEPDRSWVGDIRPNQPRGDHP